MSRVLSSGWQRPGNGANEGRPLTAGRMVHSAHGSAVLLEFVWPATRQAWERICSWGRGVKKLIVSVPLGGRKGCYLLIFVAVTQMLKEEKCAFVLFPAFGPDL